MKERYLILEDGNVFKGEAFGADKEALGELVFTTGMVGYLETLSDPSYYGQIVVQTFPIIGNYGVIEEDFEGELRLNGYVVREWCPTPSNFRSMYDIDTLLKKRGIPGISGLDTRRLTKMIRERGVMNAKISDTIPTDISDVKNYNIIEAVRSVTCKETEAHLPAQKKYRVVLIDYGAKRNIVRELIKRGCEVIVVPSTVTAEEVLAYAPDGIMLSNGPGNPAHNMGCVEEIKKLFGKTPIFGICMGHQLLALANGGRSLKLKYGHRGANQPVKETSGERTYITSQNHGYAVDAENLENGVMTYANANDGTCEGIDYPGHYAFSVQFHPEACSGPKDTEFLFEKFIGLIEQFKADKK
jgi:carbamoyl-phosphate synthase small subunit